MPLFTSKSLIQGGSGADGGTQTFNTSGIFTAPAGVQKVSIKGYGGTGTPGNPGNAACNGRRLRQSFVISCVWETSQK